MLARHLAPGNGDEWAPHAPYSMIISIDMLSIQCKMDSFDHLDLAVRCHLVPLYTDGDPTCQTVRHALADCQGQSEEAQLA